MPTVRHARISQAIKEYVGQFLITEIKDPCVGFTTITRVELSKDYHYAKIFYSVLEDKEKSMTGHALTRARGFIQSRLADHLGLRTAPQIRFMPDESIERSIRINNLIAEATKDLPPIDLEEKSSHDPIAED